MVQNPNPVKCKPVNMEKKNPSESRSIYCSFYSGCIDVALKKDWENFSCTQCPHYGKSDTPSASTYANNQPPSSRRFVHG
jgi:hypothetical protein